MNRFSGCLLGLALGDALGAPYEGGILERGLWRLIGNTRQGLMRYTDDTQMSMDLAESLLHCQGWNADDAAQRFANSYRFSRGYGPGAAKVLKKIAAGMPWQRARLHVYPHGSWGNGGAMRALGPVHTNLGIGLPANRPVCKAHMRRKAYALQAWATKQAGLLAGNPQGSCMPAHHRALRSLCVRMHAAPRAPWLVRWHAASRPQISVNRP